jgi:DNA polymerase III subunit delta'
MKVDQILNPFYTNKLFGLANELNDLINLQKVNKFPKALLLSGKKGSGKFTLVNHFLNYTFDKNYYNLTEQTIDEKSLVFQNIISGSFQNIIYLRNDNVKKTKIEDIRNLKSLLYKSTLNDEPRFIIIDDVELLQPSSSNALLKIIEEPTSKNFFILIDNKSKDLLETISSRCIKNNIFINQETRNMVIKSIIKDNKLDNILDFDNNSELTPGAFLTYNNICVENKISMDQDYLIKIDTLLKLYKKKKDIVAINLSIFLTDQHFYKLSINQNEKVSVYNDVKINIIKNINNFVIYNLNLSSVLNSIENKFLNA